MKPLSQFSHDNLELMQPMSNQYLTSIFDASVTFLKGKASGKE
jgi:hypothetical protein